MKGSYYGSPGNFKFRIAFTQIGPIELEIIQPLEGKNIYQDFLESHGEGLHHLLFDVEDIDQLKKGLEPLGINMIQSGTGIRPGTTWAYWDTASLVGFIIEVRNRVSSSDGITPNSFRDEIEEK
jgi:methylmalonyl-CoA/ethylmalonyl-CoA epimerase